MATFNSVQQTIYNALGNAPTSLNEIAPGSWAKGNYLGTYDNTTGTVTQASTLQMVTILTSCIVIAVSFLYSVSMGSAQLIFGSTSSTSKYGPAATTYTVINTWISLMLGATLLAQAAAAGAGAAAGEIVCITENNVAALPATGMEALWVETGEPW